MENVKLVLTMQYPLAAEKARENACFLTQPQGTFLLRGIFKHIRVLSWYKCTISTLTSYLQYSRKCVLLCHLRRQKNLLSMQNYVSMHAMT